MVDLKMNGNLKPAANTAESPKSLKSETTESAIILSWNEPQKNIDGSTPANILGYNVYRFSDKPENAKALNQSPINDTKFLDKSFTNISFLFTRCNSCHSSCNKKIIIENM